MKVTAIVEKGSDGLYSIYSEQEINNHSFGGYGESVEAAKADFMLSIDEAKEMVKEETGTLPNEGINESKMRQYKSGVAFAGERTTNKILTAIKKMGTELSSASL